jgi:hypothetical protein
MITMIDIQSNVVLVLRALSANGFSGTYLVFLQNLSTTQLRSDKTAKKKTGRNGGKCGPITQDPAGPGHRQMLEWK